MADVQALRTAEAFPFRPASATRPRGRAAWRLGLQGSEFAWAIAFIIPYAALFLAFVAYPVVYGLWLGREPALYFELMSEPIYQRTVVNTILYLGIGVNLKMFGALLLSGFFMRRGWWVKGLLLIYVLPWAVPALPSFISIHWMLNGQWGLINNALYNFFGVDGPGWLETSRWLALGSVIASHIWKWMPFWTVILLAGRMAIPQELYEAADMDGATGLKRFTYVSFPLLANLYLVCTLLSTLFTLGDFNSVYFVSGGGPALSTHVLATLGIRDAFEMARPDLGVAVVMSALPLMIPLVILLMRKLHTTEVQL
jgi:multiple sugar transport system permease protein